MIRYFIRYGDKTTSNGTVVEGLPMVKHYNKELSYIGALVVCPSCKSTGQIIKNGPRLRETYYEKEPALSGDLCACKCHPYPSLIASQMDWRQEIDGNAISRYKQGQALEEDNYIDWSVSEEYDEQAKALSTTPVAGYPFLIITGTRKQYFGHLEDDGLLPRIFTQLEEEYNIYWGDEALEMRKDNA